MHLIVVIWVLLFGTVAMAQQLQKPEQILWEADSLVVSFEKEPEIETLVKLSATISSAGPALLNPRFTLSTQDDVRKSLIKNIKDGFRKLDVRLNSLQQGLEDLKNLVKMTSAQVSYLESVNRIENAFHEWSVLTDSRLTASDREEFLSRFRSYDNAALNVWRGLMPPGNNPLAFDLIETYKSVAKCNPFKILLFCVNMYEYINKGLLVEDTYFSLQNNYDKILRSQTEWGERMSSAQARCSKIALECESKWKSLGMEAMHKTYDAIVESASNAVLAEKIYSALVEIAPQRNWAVWVYDDATGYGEHAVLGPNLLQIWNQNKKDVTAIGLDPKKSNYQLQKDNVTKAFDKLYAEAKTVKQCTLVNQGEYYKDRALLLAEKMNAMLPKQTQHAVYAIMEKKNIGFKAGIGRVLDKTIATYCVDPAIRLFVVQ